MLDLSHLNKKNEIEIHDASEYISGDKEGMVIEATLYHSFSENLAIVLEKLYEWKLQNIAIFPENKEIFSPRNDVILIFERYLE